MKLMTIVEIKKDGVTGRSVASSEVSDGYSDEQLATRTIKQFRTAKEDLIARITAKTRHRVAAAAPIRVG